MNLIPEHIRNFSRIKKVWCIRIMTFCRNNNDVEERFYSVDTTGRYYKTFLLVEVFVVVYLPKAFVAASHYYPSKIEENTLDTIARKQLS